MSFRTILIENRCKLEYSLNYLICRKIDSEIKVPIDEIKTIIIDSPQVSITSFLMAELINKKVKILFSDSKHNPIGEVVPYQNNFYSYRKICEQISFEQERKDYLWKRIIQQKIIGQANNLLHNKLDLHAQKLFEYLFDVYDGDPTNREGHAAKVYFNTIFGNSFSRSDESNTINKYLNYGYSLILSSINREVKTLGYLTELGIHHIGESNPFNISCDFIEPLRPLVDKFVLKNELNDSNYKIKLISMLNMEVTYNEKNIILENGIRLYVEDLFSYLKTGDELKIRFINYEL